MLLLNSSSSGITLRAVRFIDPGVDAHGERQPIVEVEVKPFVREATLADVAPIQAMFAEFVRSTQYARYVGNDPAVASALIARLITQDDGIIFVVEAHDGLIGMLSAVSYPHPLSGELVASEVFWWLNPGRRGYGGFLLRRAERWARARGATRFSMMAPADNARVAEMYEAVGYQCVEITYQKDLL